MFCPNCGTESRTGSKFCRKCGMTLPTIPGSPDAGGAPASPTPPAPTAQAPQPDFGDQIPYQQPTPDYGQVSPAPQQDDYDQVQPKKKRPIWLYAVMKCSCFSRSISSMKLRMLCFSSSMPLMRVLRCLYSHIVI